MNSRTRHNDAFRAALWLYVLPRAAKVLLVLALVVLAALMVLMPSALQMLARLGA